MCCATNNYIFLRKRLRFNKIRSKSYDTKNLSWSAMVYDFNPTHRVFSTCISSRCMKIIYYRKSREFLYVFNYKIKCFLIENTTVNNFSIMKTIHMICISRVKTKNKSVHCPQYFDCLKRSCELIYFAYKNKYFTGIC